MTARSPHLWNSWLSALSVDSMMVPVDVEARNFAQQVDEHRDDASFAGGLFAFPVKALALELKDVFVTDHCRATGGANTMHRDELTGQWILTNTDGFGAVMALQSFTLAPRNVLILGTGITARATAKEILATFSACNVTMAFRSCGIDLGYPRLKQIPLIAATSRGFDCIINATSAGNSSFPYDSPVPEDFFHQSDPDTFVMDVNFHNQTTRFLELARRSGLSCTDGVRMNLFQAKKSFSLVYSALIGDHKGKLMKDVQGNELL